jgi:Na+/melibiose symporter-like transporter
LAFVGLFFPPEALQLNSQTLLIWLMVLLTLSHGAYSALGIMHQSWIAMLGGSTLQRSRLVSWREGLGLIGVLLASALPSVIGMAGTAVLMAVALAAALWAWALKSD